MSENHSHLLAAGAVLVQTIGTAECQEWLLTREGQHWLNALRQVFDSVSRLLTLQKDARAAGDAVSAASAADLLAFLVNHDGFTRRPFITLLDNGNFRALWKNEAGEEIGLQFLGAGHAAFVFFALLDEGKTPVTASGRDTLAGIDQQIEALGLERLMLAEKAGGHHEA